MEIPISITAYFLAAGVIFIGALLQGSIGFGLGTFGVPLLMLIDPIFVPGPLLGLALVLTLLMYRRERGAVRVSDVRWGIAGRLLGTAFAAYVLSRLAPQYFSIFVGIAVLVAIGFIVSGIRLRITPANLIGVGVISGFMGTAASIGGPAMALLYYNQSGPRIRGTLSAIFIFGTIVGMIALAVVDRFGPKEIIVILMLLPVLLSGYALSHRTARLIDRGYIRPAILSVSGIAALISIASYLMQG